jgi:molecular chaperone DnaK (HSP70)
MLTIADDVRLWSADAFNGAARFPKTTFANVAGYLGKLFDDQELRQIRADKFILNDFVKDERGLVAFQTFSLDSKDEQTIYYTEEVFAMILKYGRTLSEIQAEGATVKDAVITIPSYFN